MSVHPAGARQCHHVVVLTYARPLGRQNIMEVNLFVETAEPIKRHSAADCMDSCMEHANPNYAPQQLLSKYIPNQMVFVRPLCTSVQFSSERSYFKMPHINDHHDPNPFTNKTTPCKYRNTNPSLSSLYICFLKMRDLRFLQLQM